MVRRTYLLDLDGTLWDSRPWYAEVLAQLSGSSIGEIARQLEAGENVVGITKKYGVTKTRLTREANENGESLRLYEGTLQALDQLQKRESLIGVVTNLPGWLVTPLVKATGIDVYLDAIVTPRPGVPAKPSPHGIRMALSCLKQEADQNTWFVGDSVADAGAAEAAGVSFAWASYGYEAERPPRSARVFESFDDILLL